MAALTGSRPAQAHDWPTSGPRSGRPMKDVSHGEAVPPHRVIHRPPASPLLRNIAAASHVHATATPCELADGGGTCGSPVRDAIDPRCGLRAGSAASACQGSPWGDAGPRGQPGIGVPPLRTRPDGQAGQRRHAPRLQHAGLAKVVQAPRARFPRTVPPRAPRQRWRRSARQASTELIPGLIPGRWRATVRTAYSPPLAAQTPQRPGRGPETRCSSQT